MTNVGHFLTVDGSEDHLIKLQGLDTFTFCDADAEWDPKSGALPAKEPSTNLTVQPQPTTHPTPCSSSQPSTEEEPDSDPEAISENGNSTTTEPGDTTDDLNDCGAWGNTDDTEYYSDFPDFAAEPKALIGY